MPTPSIQTLRTDAQQVLNLDSISAVRSVVAATLANANAGTPLNPNLTTQQLWNEFYQIVTQPKSDIESIIANQLMKFMYAPPAPGGVGADGQVIFNDGGVLAGDPQFLWNKTTNLLTVTGSATITGDLTVDTSTLKVDSANNRVGIGTASPTAKLQLAITGSASAITRVNSFGNDGTFGFPSLSANSTGAFFGMGVDQNSPSAGFGFFREATGWNTALAFYTNSQTGGPNIDTITERYRIASDGVATWSNVGGVAGTAMTLNATGLGVGVGPANDKLQVLNSIGINTSTTGDLSFRNVVGTAIQRIRYTDGSGTLTIGSAVGTAYPVELGGDTGSRAVIIDGSKNLGIGVTPSAWGGTGVKVIDVGAAGSFAGSAADVGVVGNAYYNGSSWIYKTSFFSGRYAYALGTGQHQWFTAASGTAGNAITFTQAMTLDASGNLLVGTTASGGQNGFCVLRPLSAAVVATTTETAHNFGALTGTTYATFLYATTAIGSITQNGTTGVLYNINSDYRLKESVAPLSGGLARVNALKPSIYKWKSDGSSGEGFLAHELAEVVPAAVTGEKDAVNEDGSIKSQGIDMSRVVPILVAAIQELTARVQTLETR